MRSKESFKVIPRINAKSGLETEPDISDDFSTVVFMKLGDSNAVAFKHLLKILCPTSVKKSVDTISKLHVIV